MAEDQVGNRRDQLRDAFIWTKIFGAFKVALDPKKLLLAAAGILVMAFGWWLLSVVFYGPRKEPKQEDYPVKNYMPSGDMTKEKKEEIAKDESFEAYRAAKKKYQLLERTAAPGGTFRTWPWFEDRGPNPFLVVKNAIIRRTQEDEPPALEAEPAPTDSWFSWGHVRVLVEPLVKFLTPVVYLFHPDAGFWNSIYFFLIILWTLATWALFGAAITRMAAVQFARNEKIGMTEAIRFARSRYVSFISAPLFPLLLIGVLTVFLAIFGFFGVITVFIGDILVYGLLWPLVILFGLVMAVVLVGLIGWPLMYSTVSAEGSDSFDALSRSYSYVYQAPWQYLWYSFLAIAYGAVVVFFVGLMGSLMVYMGKWGVSQAPFSRMTNREPAYLFVYAPTSFGWRELLLEGSSAVLTTDQDLIKEKKYLGERLAKGKLDKKEYEDKVKGIKKGAIREQYWESMSWWNYVGAAMVSFWLGLIFLLIVGFGYSYFWSASTMIYLLMRRKVDDTELDEVHLEEDDMEEPYAPPAPPASPPSKPAGGPNLIPSESLTMRSPSTPAATEAPPGPAPEAPKSAGEAPSPVMPPPEGTKTDGPAEGSGPT